MQIVNDREKSKGRREREKIKQHAECCCSEDPPSSGFRVYIRRGWGYKSLVGKRFFSEESDLYGALFFFFAVAVWVCVCCFDGSKWCNRSSAGENDSKTLPAIVSSESVIVPKYEIVSNNFDLTCFGLFDWYSLPPSWFWEIPQCCWFHIQNSYAKPINGCWHFLIWK